MRKTMEQWMDDPLIEKVSRVIYAAIREWCTATGQPIDNDSNTGEWVCLPLNYQNHVKRVVATYFDSMKVPTAKELHDDCLNVAVKGGWLHGEFNRKRKTHPDILPWQELSFVQRQKDYIFAALLRSYLEG